MIRETSGWILGVYERIPIIGLSTRLIPLNLRKRLGNNTVSGCGLTTMPELGEPFQLRRPGFGNIARECLSMSRQKVTKGQRSIVYGVDGGKNLTCSEKECRLFRHHNLPSVTRQMFK